ncbi:DEAD/DEAH box helicase family protein [Helicobacter colisuis]|uniref:DEAD/DEAH box helicase family protein n=1 Tax=Helicobacter colisuis TaxID=2949739 RepID=UPI00202A8D14|nr:DEAD/DEAH box helicase family protein [Helicobacter colisuis]MCL9823360.1 DEAD/DEAH box helicase family protein [Helicobacter colisuis]
METISFQDFLKENKKEIRSQLNEIIDPIFKGIEKPLDYKVEIDTLLELKRKPFPTQAQLITAGVTHLKDKRSLIVSSEMGTGKTLMGIALSYSLLKSGGNVFIMSPSHLVPKWASEIEATLGKGNEAILNYEIIIIRNFKTIINYQNDRKDGTLRFFICSKEVAKLSYPRAKLVDTTETVKIKKVSSNLWQFCCSQCGKILDDAESHSFHSEPINYIEISEEGEEIKDSIFTLRDVKEYLRSKDEKFTCKRYFKQVYKCNCRNVVPEIKQTSFKEWKAGLKKTTLKGVATRYGVAEFIKKRLKKNFIDLLILDELHELKGGDTAQGTAFGMLASCSAKIVGLTGTLLNGYASSLFYILYRMNPSFMKYTMGLNYEDLSIFVDRFGAVEKEYNKDNWEYCEVEDGVVTKRGKSKKLKEIPKINPLLIKELLDFTLFLRLDEMNVELPNYQEEVISVPANDEFIREYRSYVQSVVESIIEGDKSLLGVLANDSLSILDLPHLSYFAKSKKYPYDLSYSPPVDSSFITNKDLALIRELREELAQGRKCIVFATFTNLGVSEKLENLLSAEFSDFVVRALSVSVSADKREKWIKDNPADILICNPDLVKTGLDLLDYPTIMFYQTGYNVSTLKQASRRAWRIGQKQKCKVKFFTFKETPQAVALALMSRKIKAANSLEGRLVTTENELANFAGEISIQDQIAKAILEDERNDEGETHLNEWSFKGRDWNSFEQFYLNQPYQKIIKKIEQSTISKDNTIAKKDNENSFENIVKKAVDNKTTVSIVKNGKRISVNLTADDIADLIGNAEKVSLQLSLF